MYRIIGDRVYEIIGKTTPGVRTSYVLAYYGQDEGPVEHLRRFDLYKLQPDQAYKRIYTRNSAHRYGGPSEVVSNSGHEYGDIAKWSYVRYAAKATSKRGFQIGEHTFIGDLVTNSDWSNHTNRLLVGKHSSDREAFVYQKTEWQDYKYVAMVTNTDITNKDGDVVNLKEIVNSFRMTIALE